MKIITISREFGSGGRELGKRLADVLGYDYYDKEIISTIAANENLDENFVNDTLENGGWDSFSLTFHSSFGNMSIYNNQTNLLLEQTKVIEKIAQRGQDCIVIGRNADIILQDYNPFNIFVCADMQAKIDRCIERAPENEHLTRKEIEKKIKSIDKNRANTRDIITDSPWGDRKAYHLIVNTTDWNIKHLTNAVADFAKEWFSKENL